jgi:hypothetical protein
MLVSAELNFHGRRFLSALIRPLGDLLAGRFASPWPYRPCGERYFILEQFLLPSHKAAILRREGNRLGESPTVSR